MKHKQQESYPWASPTKAWGFYQDNILVEIIFDKPTSNMSHLWTPIYILVARNYRELIRRGQK